MLPFATAVNAERHYRRDIDGLRAVAVGPIVLAHAGLPGLRGGFIGVDIFFVISGYLITSVILAEFESGRFSLAGFYRRRAVRILPALLVLLAVVQVTGLALMLPFEVGELGESVAAAAAFGANVYFFTEFGYFQPFAETRPLLHTWSLGAEEQFYLLYPLLLLSARKWLRQGLIALIVMIVVLSAGFGAAALWLSPPAGFYLLPGRAWEIGLGALVAAGAIPRNLPQRMKSWLALAGAAFLILGFVAIGPGSPVPFPAALLPCVGCALLIAYGEGAVTEPLLTAAPVRALGLISYSLYLWHWPIMAFYRLETGLHLDPIEGAALVLASVIAASLSFLLVEQPFRRRLRQVSPAPVLVTALAAVAVVSAPAAWIALHPADTWRRAGPEVRRLTAYAGYFESPEFAYQFRRGPCFRGSRDAVAFDAALCLPLHATRPNVAIVGDSHAAQYWRAFTLRHPELNVIQGTASGCRPTVGAQGAERCLEMLRYVTGPLLRSGRLHMVVLAARWQEEDLPKIRPTIAHFRSRGARVVILGPGVEYHGTFPSLLARATSHGDAAMVHVHRDLRRVALDRRLATEAVAGGAAYVSVDAIICPRGTCRLAAPDGGPMHFDYGHLTLSASRWVVDRIDLPHPGKARSGSD